MAAGRTLLSYFLAITELFYSTHLDGKRARKTLQAKDVVRVLSLISPGALYLPMRQTEYLP